MKKITIGLLLLSLLSCSNTPVYRSVISLSQVSENQVISDLDVKLQEEHNRGTFDGLVLVQKESDILYKSAFGYANRNSSIKNSTSTISDIGSVAKTFTAAAILQLHHNQKLDLSNTIGDFYPVAPEQVKTITIAQLLSHSGGIDNFHNNSDFEPMTKAEAEKRILSMALIATPGEKVAYSNAAYTLLAAIVEKVSQQSFQDFIELNFLKPLNLNSTGFYQDTKISMSNIARGYGGDNEGSSTFERELTWALIGAGGMVASIDDLNIWFTALRTGSIFPDSDSNLVLTPANERWTYGSLAIRTIKGESVLQMGGSTDFGYTALIQVIPDKALEIILLLNAYDDKYQTSTHHALSRNYIIPTLLTND